MDATTLLGIPGGTLDGLRSDMQDLVFVLTAMGLTIEEASSIVTTISDRQIEALDATDPHIAEILHDFARETIRDAVAVYHDLADQDQE